MLRSSALALTDHEALPISTILDAIKKLVDSRVDEFDPLVITQASSLSNFVFLSF